jgi:hypothetical protein
MLVQPLYNIGGVKQEWGVGDMFNTREKTVAVDGAASFTYAAADFAGGDLIVGGGAGVTGTLPTADQIIKAIMGNIFQQPSSVPYHGYSTAPVQDLTFLTMIPPNSSFRRTVINNNSSTLTHAAPSNGGVTISGTATIATANWREYIVRIMEASPAIAIVGSTTNASKALTNLNKDQARQVRVGMSIYGTGIGASAKVAAVNYDTGAVTTDVNSSATADNILITFTPTVILQALRGGNVNN